MKTILLLIMLLGVGSMSQAQISRDVHWIHGLGGDEGSWQTTAGLFQGERLINTAIRGPYPTGEGVGTMANAVRNASLNVAGPNLIGIAHSMGGVASRHIDVNNTGHFGAIITYGSPLRGARIVNAVDNGEANTYIATGTTLLLRGPQSDNNIAPLLNNVPAPDALADGVVNLIVGELQLAAPTRADLGQESGYNQSLYGAGTPTPKLFMWGDEDSPVHIRLASAFAQGPVRIPIGPFTLTFNVTEESAVNAWDFARYIYGTMEDWHRTLGYIPFIGASHRWKANEWHVGHEYMFSQSEGQWRVLTGSSYSQDYLISFWGPRPEATESDFWYCADNGLFDGDCPYNQLYQYTVQYFYNTPTDGVVPVRSQIAENTAWRPDDPNFIRRLGGDNHQSMRSSDAGRNELRAAFDERFGAAFRIDRRQ